MKRREISLDVIRCVALFSVVSVHFMLNNGYYQTEMMGTRMYIMSVMRAIFSVCVPLFIVLTGYLQCYKKVEKKYYLGIKETLIIYILASIAHIIYKNLVLEEEISFGKGVLSILNFSAANYSWYVEMYIGLFLLIPFLNLIYQGLDTKKKKQLLILTIGLLTSLPCVVNIFTFSEGTSGFDKLIPSWWQNIYPLLYYFIGCYIREYQVKINRLLNILLFVLVSVVTGAFIYYVNYGKTFVWGPWQRWESLPFVILTVLLFIFLKNLPFQSLPSLVQRGITRVASLCFGGYLVSYIFDNIFYKVLNEKIPTAPERLGYYFIIVPLVFVCSLTLSFVLRVIYLGLNKGMFLARRIRKEK